MEADSPTVAFTQENTTAEWTLAADEEMLAFLTNVAPDPADTGPMTNLPVIFTLIEPFATIVSITSSPGPSGADVDQPIGIRFDRGLSAFVMDVVPERYPGVPTGLPQPCGLTTTPTGLRNGGPETGDMLGFGMWHDGPIRPGEYPVAPPPEPATAGPVGMAGVSFGIGSANPLSGCAYQGFYGAGGVLKIESVSGGFLRGELQVSGENILAVDARHHGWDLERCSRDNPQPCISDDYVPNLTIRVEFGLPVRGAPSRIEAVAACLEG